MDSLRGQATFLINGALSEYFETMDGTHIARGPADYENRVQSRVPGAVVQCVYRNQSRQESGQARAARPCVPDVAKKARRGNLHDICDQGSIVELSAYPGPVLD